MILPLRSPNMSGEVLDGFVYLMNQKAKEIGMLNTHFANPHGLDDHKDHYSTAYDMALLTRYAMKIKHIKKLLERRYIVPRIPPKIGIGVWKNKNRLLQNINIVPVENGFYKTCKKNTCYNCNKRGYGSNCRYIE